MKVLIVEDDTKTSAMLAFLLKEKDFQVYIAENGQEAIKSIKELQPDFIVSDVNMPIMDGFKLTSRLRKDGNNTPIILYTSTSAPELEDLALRVGVTKFLSNYNVKQLFDDVSERLSRAFENNQKAISKLNSVI